MDFMDLNRWQAHNIVKVPHSQKILIKHLSIYEILDLIRHHDDSEVVKILIFIKGLYESKTIRESAIYWVIGMNQVCDGWKDGMKMVLKE
jgi:hypothetical protein